VKITAKKSLRAILRRDARSEWARSILRKTVRELATRAQTSPTSIARAEATGDVPAVQAHTLQRIEAALEQAGAEFGRDGVTVRLRRGQP
jgi:hypothetical protein